jgi:fucose permease
MLPMVFIPSELRRISLTFIPGFGALSSPLIATQFAPLKHWSFHYLTSLGLSLGNLICLIIVFKLRTQDGENGSITSPRNVTLSVCVAILTKNGQPPAETSTSQQSTMRQMLGNKSVHLLAFFILVYVGIEVTVGGGVYP